MFAHGTPPFTTVLNCRPKLVKATGHEIFNWLWPERRILRIGNGRTVVTALKVLLANIGSGLSLAIETVSVIVPNTFGTTVNVIVIGMPLVTFPSAPVIGLLFVDSVPCVVAADFSVTDAGRVFVTRTFGALKGP